MLFGVGLGPGEKSLLTLKAIDVIKKADEVIVPGKMAKRIIDGIREPRVVEFSMGGGESVTKTLAAELAERCKNEDVAFCCLGDPVFYSTFHHVVEEVLKLNPEIRIEIIPGISSVSAALAKTGVYINSSMLLTTKDFGDVDVVVVLKAKKPKEVEKNLRNLGFCRFILVEKMYMDGERVLCSIPENASYFSVLIALKGGKVE